MKNEISYEWTIEVLDGSDIVDLQFSDSLNFDKEDLVNNQLGLIRNVGNEKDGLNYRLWAYVLLSNTLPVYFYDEYNNPTSYKVPDKFHNEINKYFK